MMQSFLKVYYKLMPSGKNWIYFIYINLAFGLYMAGVFYFNQLEEIKANWPLYRCNPMYMPLADDVDAEIAAGLEEVPALGLLRVIHARDDRTRAFGLVRLDPGARGEGLLGAEVAGLAEDEV